jgi:hypothetical protein
MTEEVELDLFKPLLELRPDRKMLERLNPVSNFQQAAEIRAQAERIRAMVRRLRQSPKQGTVSSIVGELPDMKGTLTQMESSLKETFIVLARLVNNEFSAGRKSSVPPVKAHVEAYFWMSRIVGDLFSVSSYYKLTAELLSLSVKTLGNVSLSAGNGDSSLLLNHAAALLVDAAKQMGTAGTQLGDHETHWQNLERALDNLGQSDEGQGP